jgi:hypothetical protein
MQLTVPDNQQDMQVRQQTVRKSSRHDSNTHLRPAMPSQLLLPRLLLLLHGGPGRLLLRREGRREPGVHRNIRNGGPLVLVNFKQRVQQLLRLAAEAAVCYALDAGHVAPVALLLP